MQTAGGEEGQGGQSIAARPLIVETSISEKHSWLADCSTVESLSRFLRHSAG
jgi:hypothetical protein